MVNCSYCDKELNRKVFCSNSHKVLFHVKKEAIENTTKYIKQNYYIKPKEFFNPVPKLKRKK